MGSPWTVATPVRLRSSEEKRSEDKKPLPRGQQTLQGMFSKKRNACDTEEAEVKRRRRDSAVRLLAEHLGVAAVDMAAASEEVLQELVAQMSAPASAPPGGAIWE